MKRSRLSRGSMSSRKQRMQVVKTKTFDSRVTKDTAYGRVDDYGIQKNVMRLIKHDGMMFIEWTVGDDLDYAEIGITVQGKKVTDYDGVFELPKQAISLLEEAGYDTTEVRS